MCMRGSFFDIIRLATALALGLTVGACQRYEDRQASFEICHAEMTKAFRTRTPDTQPQKASFVRGCMAALGFEAAPAPSSLCTEIDLAEKPNCYAGSG